MDVVTTSLEALIQRATNPQNQKPDVAAIEAFCVMLTREPEGIQIGTKLLASHIQSANEAEALQALKLLDACMKKCGSSFHSEVGKFRFLNEMIRLVSPKYLGNRTPMAVRQKVLHLLYMWTKEYPREVKIKEAYEMLKKQGVIEDDSTFIIYGTDKSLKPTKSRNAIFEDEEKSKLLQKLLQSKNPDDVRAANILIKTMVTEDERRVQTNSRRVMELESVRTNVKLLSEMLDSYNRNETSAEDLELMKELYQACQRLKPIVLRLANETPDNDEMLGDVLATSDELGQVFDKYNAVIILGNSVSENCRVTSNVVPSLLDLSTPSETVSGESDLITSANTMCNLTTNDQSTHRSDMDVLEDIFNTLGKQKEASSTSESSLLLPDPMIMQPVSILPTSTSAVDGGTPEKKVDSKTKALEELNELGESLLKQSLLCGTIGNACSNQGKLNANHVQKIQSISESPNSISARITDNSLPIHKSHWDKTGKGLDSNKPDLIESPNPLSKNNSLLAFHAFMTKDPKKPNECENEDVKVIENDTDVKENDTPLPLINNQFEIKSLTDININLQNIKPGVNPPMTVIEEKNGISVVLHFAEDSPRSDVSVIVITTMSKNAKPLSNYMFQAVVPKKCKCRLQPPSGTELPAHNPFLPPAAITQIMLIANPHKETVSLKFMLSYSMDDETFTEMGEVDKLPHV